MQLNEYQTDARRTAKYPTERGLEYVTLGLCGEAGELANKVKKVIRDKGGVLDAHGRIELGQELGDVLWYVAAVATELGYGLDAVAVANLYKLSVRADKGLISGSGDNRGEDDTKGRDQ